MQNELVKQDPVIIQKLVLEGDIGRMSEQQKVSYYKSFCDALGLNPLTQPFQIIKFQGKEKLYATKDCTEQLRKIHGVGITDISTTTLNDVFIVTAKAVDKSGKLDAATGAVNIKGLAGDNLANALMKAETKAKRRVTLSICGLGILDETEIETIPGAKENGSISISGVDDGDKAVLRKMVYLTDMTADEKEAAFAAIDVCPDYDRYAKIQHRLEDRQQSFETIPNPSASDINKHIKKTVKA